MTFPTAQTLSPPIMKLLWRGLLGECEKSQAIAFDAIEGLGESFGVHMMVLAAGASLSPQQAQRLVEATRLAELEDSPERSGRRQVAMRRAILEGLACGEKTVRLQAMRALSKTYEDPAQVVIAEAAASREDPDRCEALLGALAEVDIEISASDWAILVELSRQFPRPYLEPAEKCFVGSSCASAHQF